MSDKSLKHQFLTIVKQPKCQLVILVVFLILNAIRIALHLLDLSNDFSFLALDFFATTFVILFIYWMISQPLDNNILSKHQDLIHNLIIKSSEKTSDPIVICKNSTDQLLNIIHINKAALKLMLHKSNRFVDKPLLSLFDSEYHPKITKWVSDEPRGGYLELEMQKGNGDILEVELNARCLDVDTTLYFVVIMRDISEKLLVEKRIEEYATNLEWKATEKTEALLESEKNYSSLMRSMDDIVLSIDINGHFTFNNPAWSKFRGGTNKQLTGMHYLDIIHDSDKERMEMLYEQAIKEKLNISQIEFRAKSKNGNWRTLSGNLSLLYDLGNKITGSVIVIRDITDKKKMQEWMAYTERMESVGLLASGLAHDFNNLFQEMLGFTRRIKRNSYKNEDVLKDTESIEMIVERATRFVKQLLSFASSQKKQVESFSPNDSVERTKQLLGRSFGDKIKIVTKLNSNQQIEGDESQFDQVFLNLVFNARDAIGDIGKITVTTSDISSDDYSQIPVNTPGLGRYVIIQISDTGSGIPKEIQQKIFDPFFTTKKDGKGTGLGLSTVYGIIKNHGGVVSVESAIGEGTTFTIVMPAKMSTKEMQAQSESEADKPQITVLLIDDDHDICSLTKEALQYEGYKVLTAHTGKQAIESYKAFTKQIDIVVMDMIMPEMDGLTAAGEMRKINPESKIILSTGQTIAKNSDGWKNISMLLEKPYAFEKLIEAILKILG